MTIERMSIEVKRAVLRNYDVKILQLLGKRLQLSKEIGKLKKKNNMPVYNRVEWQKKCEVIKKECKKLNIEYTEIISIFHQIHRISIELQEKI